MKTRRILATVLSLVMILGTMSFSVFADETNSAKIGTTEYATFADAFAAATTGDTIVLLRDITEGGVKIGYPESITLTIDLGGYTFTVGTPTVGSTGTETNGFQILQGSNVTIQNGTITSTTAKHLIQNYADLTLKNVILDGSNLKYDEEHDSPLGQVPNTLSHNNGTLKIEKDCVVIGHKLGYAFDVCEWGSYSGATAEVESGATITGLVEIKNYYTDDAHDNGKTTSCKLTIGSNEYTTQGWYTQSGNNSFTALYTPPAGEVFNNSLVNNENQNKPVMYNVTYKSNGNATGTTYLFAQGTITIGKDPEDAENGYKFVYWVCNDSVCEESYLADSTFNLTKDVEFTAVYEELPTWELKFVPNGGKMTNTSVLLVEGETIDVSLSQYKPVKSGYTFGGWYRNSSLTQKINGLLSLTDDMTVYAKWTKSGSYYGGGSSSAGTYYTTIKFNTNGGYTMDSLSVKINTAVGELKNPIKRGYIFKGWYTDTALTKAFDPNTKISKSMTLNAAWEPVDASAQLVLTIGSKDAVVYGEAKSNDVAPIIVSDRTMLPARFVAENLGANVEWNEDERLVTITGKNLKTGEDVTILIYIDSDKAVVNGVEIALDSAAFIENDRTYTPVRFVAESLGADVDWTEETSAVTITAKF